MAKMQPSGVDDRLQIFCPVCLLLKQKVPADIRPWKKPDRWGRTGFHWRCTQRVTEHGFMDSGRFKQLDGRGQVFQAQEESA